MTRGNIRLDYFAFKLKSIGDLKSKLIDVCVTGVKVTPKCVVKECVLTRAYNLTMFGLVPQV